MDKTKIKTEKTCKCKKRDMYGKNAFGELICGSCQKKLDQEQTHEVGRSMASYHGW